MIVWLASYPRSGNTMFRMMLHQVFDLPSYSRHFRPERLQTTSNASPLQSYARPLPGPWEEAYRFLSNDPALHIVKTHEAPQDSQPAIYIVRNGLAAARSYKHYLSDIRSRDYSLDQIILGEALFGSWGTHLDAWNPLTRPDTLMLRYEDLVCSPDREFDRVASFLRLPRLRKWVNNFDKLHAANPRFFRQGPSVSPEHGFSARQLRLFSAVHGDWMARLDYAPPAFTTPRELRAVFTAASAAGQPPGVASAVPTGPAPLEVAGRERVPTPPEQGPPAHALSSSIPLVSRLLRLLKRPQATGLLMLAFSLSASHLDAAMPDLLPNAYRLRRTVEFQRRLIPQGACARVEGCVRGGATPKLLLFDTGIANVGKSDLVIGDPASRPQLFEFSPCHGHYHMQGVARYRLFTRNWRLVIKAVKQGFCLRDDKRYLPSAAGQSRYDCEHQGISRGWQDVYDKSLDCQWVDISGVPPGKYYLEVVVNPRRILPESNYLNNKVIIPITVPRVPR